MDAYVFLFLGLTFLVVAGLRFDTCRYDSGPNAGASGPRWRLGPRPRERIPADAYSPTPEAAARRAAELAGNWTGETVADRYAHLARHTIGEARRLPSTSPPRPAPTRSSPRPARAASRSSTPSPPTARGAPAASSSYPTRRSARTPSASPAGASPSPRPSAATTVGSSRGGSRSPEGSMTFATFARINAALWVATLLAAVPPTAIEPVAVSLAPSLRLCADVVVAAIRGANALLVGLALGAHGTVALRSLPHLLLESASLAAAGTVYAAGRGGGLHGARTAQGLLAAAVLVVAAAAAEVHLTPQ
jgi:hypothetical protein